MNFDSIELFKIKREYKELSDIFLFLDNLNCALKKKATLNS